MSDLGRFLDINPWRIKKWARKHDYLRKQGITARPDQGWWISTHAARLCILHFRSIQGAAVLIGTKRTDPWFNKEWDRTNRARCALRKVKKAEEP